MKDSPVKLTKLCPATTEQEDRHKRAAQSRDKKGIEQTIPCLDPSEAQTAAKGSITADNHC